MRYPVTAGLAAGALWGLTFVAPYFIGAASAGELVLMRYLAYGVLSIAWLWRTGYNPFARLPPADWARLILFGALGNSLYYLLMVMSVRAGSAAVTALLIGTLPVMFAIVANVRRPTVPWLGLILALAPIVAGILLLSSRDGAGATLAFTPSGTALALAAMANWLVYGLANASHMGTGASPMLWSALVGLGTLLTLPFLAAGAFLREGALFELGIEQYYPVLLWGLVLGVLSSWLATWLWNIASAGISPVLLGYLLVSETVFALVYAFVIDRRLPDGLELISAALLIGGTLAGLRVYRAGGRKPAGVRQS